MIEPQFAPEDENEFSDQTNESKSENNNSLGGEPQEDNLLEFESGLHQLIKVKPTQKENNSEEVIRDNENGLEFTSVTPTDLVQTNKDEENTKLSNLKNTKALDTLLALAKTYIGMEDIESALHSLNEVMVHGSKAQKEEAKRLLNEIKRNS